MINEFVATLDYFLQLSLCRFPVHLLPLEFSLVKCLRSKKKTLDYTTGAINTSNHARVRQEEGSSLHEGR